MRLSTLILSVLSVGVVAAQTTCTNGISGLEAGGVCCSTSCGRCGGTGCGQLPGGNDNCCTSAIKDNGDMCSATREAPCIMDEESTTPTPPTPTPPTPANTDDVCTNGISGFETAGVCCSASCGRCGGTGCGQLLGGNDNCCTSAIKDNGDMCSSTREAPCIMDEESTTPTPPTPTPPTPANTDDVCTNGISGFEAAGVCCSASCGRCGGTGCRDLTGGSDNCCTSAIKDNGDMCSATREAPCIMDEESTTPTPPTPTPPTPANTDDVCTNGISGFEAAGVCCSASCGRCGGTGCGQLLGGNDNCCTSAIKDNGDVCSSTREAPCIMDEESTIPSPPTPTPPTPANTDDVCTNGFPGFEAGGVCCSITCGVCGGPGCSSLVGGSDECCTGDILLGEVFCTEAGAAPCIVDNRLDPESGPTPTTPTPPLTPTPPSPTPTTTGNGAPMCRNGFFGIQDREFCCPVVCGFCGGSGCSTRNGENCCTSASNVSCSEKGDAPCVLDPISRDFEESNCDHTTTIDLSDPGMAYLKSGGCAKLTDIYDAQSGNGPLYVLDANDNIVNAAPTGRWLLTSSLVVEDNVTLFIKGKNRGGDCDVLRIQSTDDDFWELTGHGGSLYFEGTKVTSWDTDRNEEREYTGDPMEGRSFVRCLTQFDDTADYNCANTSSNDKGTCRMDIIDSTMGNMGYLASESYGLSWKVRGLCTISGKLENLDIFDTHQVYGDITNSDIYGMYYGHYSYGHQGGVWTHNKMHDNVVYGFDPHDDSDDLTIAHNEVYNNGNHGIIASKRCNNVKIFNNTVHDGGTVGIFLHRSSDNAQVYDNTIYNNKDAGIAYFESFGGTIRDNTVTDCKYGIRLSVGASDNMITNNKFTNIGFRDPDDDESSPGSGFYTYRGSDKLEVSSNGRPSRNVFEGNTLTNAYLSVEIEDGDDNVFNNNNFMNAGKFEFEDSTDTLWTDNTITGGGCIDDDQNDEADFARGSDVIPDTSDVIPRCTD